MTSTLFVTDEKIWQNCRKFFAADFLDNFAEALFLKDPWPDEKNLKIISKALKNCDFILALGSGTINDLCKFTAAEKNIPYAIFASAPSMNGYLSRNASITISGHKKTLAATLPEAVFCDLKILQAAPADLIKAGIGDSLCFYSCWFDWYLSHQIFGTKFDPKPFEMLREKMEFLLKNFRNFSLRDEKFLELLIEILLLSGEGMTIAGGSYPASQSEHLIAHTIEMKYPQLENLHGQVIAVTTLTSARLQKKILTKTPSSLAQSAEDLRQDSRDPRIAAQFKDDGRDLDGARMFFGKKIAKQCAFEYAQKLALKPKKVDWVKLKKELQKIHLDESRLKEIFKHFKIKTSARSLGMSSQQYRECVANAKFIRNRFTCLDLMS